MDGVRTTHHQGAETLDGLRKALRERDKGKDEAVREQHEKGLDRYREMGVEQLTMDTWIDGRDHTKQFRRRGDGTQGPLDLTITFLDLNQPVKVTAPPAKDTADLSEMLKEAGKG
ncbi:hypothetical protein ACF061_08320 [Streptomyces sp. NPDC015220]|uniref:hypothetical protein n=1 Tax=Streptomyces sp. NPDC015220 TaxID=3364947 RepID=UPI0036F8683C